MTKNQNEQKVNPTLTMRSPVLTNSFRYESRQYIIQGEKVPVGL